MILYRQEEKISAALRAAFRCVIFFVYTCASKYFMHQF